VLPQGLAQALGPLLHQIADMAVKIKQYDREIQRLTEAAYPETQALVKVYGVGNLTALTFALTLGKRSASSEVVMSAAISACSRDGASPVIATLNLEYHQGR
jgi:hypothetical protein